MTDHYLGVDGGGTKTEFLVVNAAGEVVAQATTGTTYHLEIGIDEAVRRLAQGIAAVCDEAKIAPADFAFAFFGLPGHGEDRVADPKLEAACGVLLGHNRYACGNDVVCGWAGSLGCEDGINIVAGTGSIGYGERQGVSARTGGWGEVFGDEGSAHWIAVQGLATFARMSDGRIPKGPLHRGVVEALRLEADIDLCERVMGPPAMTRGETAALAPLVTAAAADGDEAAQAILREAARHLADHALALRATLGFAADELVALSWSGSILAKVAPVTEHFVALLLDANFRFLAPRHSPAYGAALYAKALRARG